MFVTFSYTDTFEERSEYHKAKKRKKMTEDSESSEQQQLLKSTGEHLLLVLRYFIISLAMLAVNSLPV